MTKIYEALRQYERESMGTETRETEAQPVAAPRNGALRTPGTEGGVPERELFDVETPGALYDAHYDFSSAFRNMQVLYRSVESAVDRTRGGIVILFSSAHSCEGKTTVCGSYALTAARQFGRSVLVLDGDRHHVLSRRFRTSEDTTLSTLEQSPEAVLRGAQRAGTHGALAAVSIDSPSASPNDPSTALKRIANAKEKLAKVFDYILIDAPSVAEASWSAFAGSVADGVILVIEAERTRWPVALHAKQELEKGGGRVLGVFLNKRRFYIPPPIYRHL